MATTVGDVAIRVGADIGPLQRNMRKGGGSVDKFGRQAATTAKKVAKITAAVTAVSVVLGTKMVKSTLAAVDAQAKLARQLDGTIDGLRSVQIAGSDAGVEAGVLNKAMEKLTSRLGEAMEGTGEAAKALRMLGLDAKELADMDIDQRMATLADRMEELDLSAAEAGNALRDLGVRNGEIINLMRQGGDAIRDAKEELRGFGLSITEIDAAKIERANDAMERIGFAGEAIAQAFTVELAPTLESVANEISTQFKEAGNDMRDGIGGAVDFGIAKFAQLLTGAASIVDFIEQNPDMAKFGLLGFMILGKKGAVIGSIIGGTFDVAREKMVEMGLAAPKAMNPIVQEIEVLQSKLENVQFFLNQAMGVDLGPGDAIYDDLIEKATLLQVEISNLRGSMEDGGEAQQELNRLMEAGSGSSFSLAQGMRDVAQAMLDSREQMQEAAAEGGEVGIGVLFTPEQLSEESERFMQHGQDILQDQKDFFEQRIALTKWANLEEAKIEAEGKAEQEKIAQQHRTTMLNEASTGFGRLASLMETNHKGMFEIGKAAAISQTVIDTYAAAQASYKSLAGIPFVGPALGAAAAGAAIVGGLARVQAISSRSFSKSGAAAKPGSGADNQAAQASQGSGGGGGGAETTPQQQVNLSLQGDVFSRNTVIGLIDQLNEAVADGAKIRVA